MTTICNFIKDEERNVWDYLSRVFNFQLRAAELGFTNDLVFKIREFYDGFPYKCELFTKHSKNEDKRGADIELSIFNGKTFDCFLLQSKIMNYSGIYTDIRKFDRKNKQNNQYSKIIRTAKDEGKFPLYLLFNGDSRNSCWCGNDLGYTMISARNVHKNRVESYYENPTRTPRIRHNGICCEMNPFHYLFCPGCKTGYVLPPGKTYQEIYRGDPYIKLFGSINPSGNTNENNNLENNTNQVGNIKKPRFIATYKIIIDDPDIYG